MTSTSRQPTSVNPDLVGCCYGPFTYEVAAITVREFAAAVGAQQPEHYDRAAAQAAGYRDIVATPTFAVVIAQAAEAAYIQDERAGIDFSRVVHADESFTHTRPIQAGDTLSTTVTVQSITQRGPICLVTTRADITDSDGPVCQVTSTLAVRGETA